MSFIKLYNMYFCFLIAVYSVYDNLLLLFRKGNLVIGYNLKRIYLKS